VSAAAALGCCWHLRCALSTGAAPSLGRAMYRRLPAVPAEPWSRGPSRSPGGAAATHLPQAATARACPSFTTLPSTRTLTPCSRPTRTRCSSSSAWCVGRGWARAGLHGGMGGSAAMPWMAACLWPSRWARPSSWAWAGALGGAQHAPAASRRVAGLAPHLCRCATGARRTTRPRATAASSSRASPTWTTGPPRRRSTRRSTGARPALPCPGSCLALARCVALRTAPQVPRGGTAGAAPPRRTPLPAQPPVRWSHASSCADPQPAGPRSPPACLPACLPA
jgi:hypothetical protein